MKERNERINPRPADVLDSAGASIAPTQQKGLLQETDDECDPTAASSRRKGRGRGRGRGRGKGRGRSGKSKPMAEGSEGGDGPNGKTKRKSSEPAETKSTKRVRSKAKEPEISEGGEASASKTKARNSSTKKTKGRKVSEGKENSTSKPDTRDSSATKAAKRAPKTKRTSKGSGETPAEPSTKPVKPPKTTKEPARELSEAEKADKQQLSRKSSAYHKAKRAALKEGLSTEAATEKGKEAPCLPSIRQFQTRIKLRMVKHNELYTSQLINFDHSDFDAHPMEGPSRFFPVSQGICGYEVIRERDRALNVLRSMALLFRG